MPPTIWRRGLPDVFITHYALRTLRKEVLPALCAIIRGNPTFIRHFRHNSDI